MTIIPSTERYVYQVPSERNSKVRYRVDIVANEGAVRCSCSDFSCRRQPNIDAGMPVLTRETRCKHLAAVHQYFLREILTELAYIEDGTR